MTELATELRQEFSWIAEHTDNNNFDLEKLFTWVDLSPWPIKNLGTPGDPAESGLGLKRWLAKRLDIPADDGWKTSARQLCFAPDLIKPILLAPALDTQYRELLAHAA
jgi:hypothetical protein